MAFPGISTGVYGYPMSSAARAALVTITEYLKKGSSLEEITIVLFSDEALTAWKAAFPE